MLCQYKTIHCKSTNKNNFCNKWYHTYQNSLENLNQFIMQFLKTFYSVLYIDNKIIQYQEWLCGVVYGFVTRITRLNWSKTHMFICNNVTQQSIEHIDNGRNYMHNKLTGFITKDKFKYYTIYSYQITSHI